jgi:hypothetical protein
MSEALRGALSAPLRRGTRDLTDGSRVVQAPLLDACAHRGEVITQREAPCCGGKFRREELYRCNHPRNEAQEAWSVVCRHCVLEKAT